MDFSKILGYLLLAAGLVAPLRGAHQREKPHATYGFVLCDTAQANSLMQHIVQTYPVDTVIQTDAEIKIKFRAGSRSYPNKVMIYEFYLDYSGAFWGFPMEALFRLLGTGAK